MRDFPGLRDLARHNAALLQEVWQLIPRREDSSSSRAQVGDSPPVCQESLKALDNLIQMAEVLQEVAVSRAAIL